MVPGDFLWPDDFAFVACKARNAIDILEPVDLLIRGGEAKAAALVPGNGLACQLFKLGIEFGAIHMHLGHVERAIEVRALTGRMPGRARGQFALLDEHNVRPALKSKMVEKSYAHDTASDNDYAGMGFHVTAPDGVGPQSSLGGGNSSRCNSGRAGEPT